MVADNPPENPAARVPKKSRAPAAGSTAAHGIISQFGGIRPMAGKLGIAVSTVQGWRERGSIPAGRRARILAAAKAHGIEIDEAALAASERPGSAAAETPAAAAKAPEAGPDTKAPGEIGPDAKAPGEGPDAKAPGETGPPPRRAGRTGLQAGVAGAWLGGFILGGVVLGLGAGGAVITRDLWLPAAEPTLAAAGGDAARLSALEARIAALESAPLPEAVSGDPAALESLREGVANLDRTLAAERARAESLAARVTATKSDLAALEDRVAALAAPGGLAGEMAALKAQVGALADLEGRVAALAETSRLEHSARSAAAGDTALVFAVLQLRDALRGSGPFAAEFEMLRRLAAAREAGAAGAVAELVSPLAPHAARGVPTLATLKAGFPAAARAIVAQGQGGPEGDWIDGMLRRLSGLVTVRPLGPVEGLSPGAVAARAEAKLMAGDLAGALAELKSLSGRAAEAAAPWRARAEARLLAERVLTGLGQSIVQRLAPAGG
ncbi:MAG: COG4223 family protein [Kiloniellaceae bacterium]